MAEFVKVASANEIAPGHSRLVNIKALFLLIFLDHTHLLADHGTRFF
jgi:hypothetical protein